MLSLSRIARILGSGRARRRRARGFGHISQTIEAAAIMGWFVILVLGEKFVSDATSARRSAELSVQQQSVASAMGTCTGVGLGSILNGPSPVSARISIADIGVPKLTIGSIPSLILGLGIGNLRTLPLYFRPFQSTTAQASSKGVTAGPPLNFRSGDFQASRQLACLEPSLDLPGAPWITLAESRIMIFITNILGYRL